MAEHLMRAVSGMVEARGGVRRFGIDDRRMLSALVVGT
jgi:hypothetical protein